MAFSDDLLELGEPIWAAQREHPFVTELAAGTLAEEAFLHWVKQDYRYLLDYARTFSVAGARARDEETMTHLMGIAHTTLDYEMDLHREFAADYGIDPADLETVEKAPTCVAYTNFLVRTAHEGSLAEIAAAIYPCGQGYLDVAAHMAELSEGTHRYTPFIEKYTDEEFLEVVEWMRELVDRCGERYPGEREAMEAAFLTSARLEHAFWEMAYTREGWEL
ncbi:thiaminase II [Halalkalicoccus jeotgali]|uniref:Transcriptional activator, TenA family protein n=1 Tax=Halalkalicoccus jeotgali (strain DSM 18796 / CECT 7217 / JCM 14584 / KCTC 4019 / B3) TaxID=795797 RepID=D8J538_HALJB|nr:thiaminase II [Halalkalicoccus jeotgali]ADJ13619.1 transcriptional activator, TenA family protein [Halalkalicoccus jeotgali B3]ELY33359.1 transcriptional activator, TenA family protein [Halalkalicoccus jeotgali B3]